MVESVFLFEESILALSSYLAAKGCASSFVLNDDLHPFAHVSTLCSLVYV